MSGGLSPARLARMRDVMAGHVARGHLPGLVTLVCRRDDVHVEAIGAQAPDGDTPMQRDTIFRVASLTKPVAATAALILIEECRLQLDEPLDRLLPELADRRVLSRLDAPLDDTVAAKRPLTVRDLLTMRMGIGYLMDSPGDHPIEEAARAQGLLLGPPRPQAPPAPDAWMRGIGTLPLMRQPGDAWMYDVAMDVLGVLIARAADQPLERFLRERIFEPLGMTDTGFHVPSAQHHRLPACYDTRDDALVVYDPAGAASEWARPPAFPSASGGLVSTVDDYLAFGRMLLNGGRHGRERILSRLSVELMTTDQLTAEQRAGAGVFLGGNRGWGLGLSVFVMRDDVSAVPGRFGWEGGLGTSWACDPREQLVAILLSQSLWTSPSGPQVYRDFWTSVYQAIDD